MVSRSRKAWFDRLEPGAPELEVFVAPPIVVGPGASLGGRCRAPDPLMCKAGVLR
jgi:hypothetical protein